MDFNREKENGEDMKIETVIYGVLYGEPDYMEQVLYGGGEKLSDSEIESVRYAASKDGFGRFRVWEFKHGEKPGFTEAAKI